jgi:hypothetical protein
LIRWKFVGILIAKNIGQKICSCRYFKLHFLNNFRTCRFDN